jgi:hypothetical protein
MANNLSAGILLNTPKAKKTTDINQWVNRPEKMKSYPYLNPIKTNDTEKVSGMIFLENVNHEEHKRKAMV